LPSGDFGYMDLISRRGILRAAGGTLGGLALGAATFDRTMAAPAAQSSSPQRRPNILHIVADDLGWKDVGFHGSEIRTPNIDRLAAQGARLEQFYVQPMCTPTRACLMTGRYPFRYGLQTLVIPSTHTWQTLSEDKASPRTEIIYNLEPFRAGIRQGDWKLIWRTPLPQAVELYNIAQDPSEKNNLAAEHPDKVAALQKRAIELAATMAKPLLLQSEFKAMLERLHMPPALPGEEFEFNEEP
jgi:arylsulfatase A-like enzyme